MAAGEARRSNARARRDRRRSRGQPSSGLSDGADHADAGRIQAGYDGAGTWHISASPVRVHATCESVSLTLLPVRQRPLVPPGIQPRVQYGAERVAELIGVRCTEARLELLMRLLPERIGRLELLSTRRRKLD